MKLAQNGNAVQPRVAAVAERIARGQLRVLWPQAVRENRLHLRDEPGIHLDEGTYANQLRYHDSEGVLRGILVLYHEAEDEEKEAEYEWDHHGDQDLATRADLDCGRPKTPAPRNRKGTAE